MEFKVRKVTKADGGVDLRICLSLSADEAHNVPRIADWDETNLSLNRATGTVEQRADWVLMQARLLAYWADIWNNRDQNSQLIMQSIQAKEARKPHKRKRR